MTPGVTDVDETGDAPMGADIGGLVDTAALDAAQRRELHPFAKFCDEVREAEGLGGSQAAREVVSAVCNAVARLTLVTEEDLEEQAQHIAKLVAKDREERGDRQLWVGPASKIATRALKLRLED